jgi:hypothetical protein
LSALFPEQSVHLPVVEAAFLVQFDLLIEPCNEKLVSEYLSVIDDFHECRDELGSFRELNKEKVLNNKKEVLDSILVFRYYLLDNFRIGREVFSNVDIV